MHAAKRPCDQRFRALTMCLCRARSATCSKIVRAPCWHSHGLPSMASHIAITDGRAAIPTLLIMLWVMQDLAGVEPCIFKRQPGTGSRTWLLAAWRLALVHVTELSVMEPSLRAALAPTCKHAPFDGTEPPTMAACLHAQKPLSWDVNECPTGHQPCLRAVPEQHTLYLAPPGNLHGDGQAILRGKQGVLQLWSPF